VIDLLGPGHHIVALERVDGYSSFLHHAAIRDRSGVTRNAYVKAFPAGTRGIANELCGWIWHKAYGMQTAERAWIMLLPAGKLRAIFPEVDWPGGDDSLLTTWVTETIMDHDADSTVPLVDGMLWADRIAAWPALHDAIALGNLLHNTDSNGGNLIATGLTDFALVDFAEILGGQHWTRDTICNLRYNHNKIAYLAWNGFPSKQDKEAIEAATVKASTLWPEIKQFVTGWWRDLIRDQLDCEAGLTWLEKQANKAAAKGKKI
jgi:hypothetical protein